MRSRRLLVMARRAVTSKRVLIRSCVMLSYRSSSPLPFPLTSPPSGCNLLVRNPPVEKCLLLFSFLIRYPRTAPQSRLLPYVHSVPPEVYLETSENKGVKIKLQSAGRGAKRQVEGHERSDEWKSISYVGKWYHAFAVASLQPSLLAQPHLHPNH